MRPRPATSSPRWYRSFSGFGHRAPWHAYRRVGLARWTGEVGDAAAARDQWAALLLILERVRGAKNPEALMIRTALAHWTELARKIPGGHHKSRAA